VIYPALVAIAVLLYGAWSALRAQLVKKAANLPGATVVLSSDAEAASIKNDSVVPASAVVITPSKAA
jgi:hypothetical protein